MRCSMNQWENGKCPTILITVVEKKIHVGAVNVQLVSKRGIGCRDVRRWRQGLEQKAVAVNPFHIWKPKSHAHFFFRLWFWFKKTLIFILVILSTSFFYQAPFFSSHRGSPLVHLAHTPLSFVCPLVLSSPAHPFSPLIFMWSRTANTQGCAGGSRRLFPCRRPHAPPVLCRWPPCGTLRCSAHTPLFDSNQQILAKNIFILK